MQSGNQAPEIEHRRIALSFFSCGAATFLSYNSDVWFGKRQACSSALILKFSFKLKVAPRRIPRNHGCVKRKSHRDPLERQGSAAFGGDSSTKLILADSTHARCLLLASSQSKVFERPFSLGTKKLDTKISHQHVRLSRQDGEYIQQVLPELLNSAAAAGKCPAGEQKLAGTASEEG